MSLQSVQNRTRALEGMHGVHVALHSPFTSTETDQRRNFQLSTCETSATRADQQLSIQRMLQQKAACLTPIHLRFHSHGDQTLAETVANVLTSLPFIALGMNSPRKNLNSKMYANSLIGVGMASSMYHSSRGKLRKFLRWVDYTMIATATVNDEKGASPPSISKGKHKEDIKLGVKTLAILDLLQALYFPLLGEMGLALSSSRFNNQYIDMLYPCLSRALRNENPKLLMAASAVCLPVHPMMVSVVHTGMMEVAFARRALKDPDLRMAHTVHKMSSLVGGMLFIADDLFPKTPFIHAAWHLAAAVGVGTCNKLLE